MRRLLAVVIILVILAGAWTAGWFWLADWADRNAEAALAKIGEQGIEVACADRQVIGFPFAMRIVCSSAELAEPRSGLSAEVAGASGGASVFAPTTAELRLQSPARVAGAVLAKPAEATWEQTAINVGMGMSGPRAISFDTEGFATEIAIADLPTIGLSVGEAEGEVSPSDNGGTAVAASFTGLAASVDGAALPTLDGSASATIPMAPRALLAGGAALRPPISAEEISVSLRTGGARIDIDGDISVDAEGIVDGKMRLRLAGAQALPSLIAALPEQYQREANAVVGGLIAFGQPTTLDGEPASEVTVTIARGVASIGPVDVELPRLPI
jgi:hypothetical protein